jgi:hypothetical protein
MVPEYALHGQLSVKAGILLLEHATGRKNTYYKLSPEIKTLLEWVRSISIVFPREHIYVI